MISFKEWITEREFSFQTITALVFFLIGTAIAMIGVVIPNIKDYFPQSWIHLIMFVVVEVAIVLWWYWNRAVFPKIRSTKGNIIIAIETENAKQKTRITHDFQKEIKKQLQQYNLENTYTVTVLHNHLSRIIKKKIGLYTQSLKAGINNSNEVEDFKRLKERLNVKFVIYGDLITRNASNSTYCLSLDGMMCHTPTTKEGKEKLNSEFKSLWKKEVTFLEENELMGFKENAEYIFFTASYMLALSSFIDNNYLHGIQIWNCLEEFIRDKPDLKKYELKIRQLKAASYMLQSRMYYFEGNFRESVVYRDKYHQIFPDEYNSCLNEAMRQVKLRNDQVTAMEFINRAEKTAPNDDGTWKYSKLYLLIKLGRMADALTIMDDILNSSFRNESDVVNQVLSYNQDCLVEDPNHIQTYFINAVCIFKKMNQPIDSYDKFEEFLQQTKDNDFWVLLNKRAQEYLIELDDIIGIKK